MNNEAELLRQYAEEGSQAAFTELVRLRVDLVYSAALRRTGGNTVQAGDVVQHVFLTAAKRAAALSRHPALTGWFYTATRNATLNIMRDEKRRFRLSQALGSAAEAPAVLSADVVDWDKFRPLLDDAMDDLNDKDRHAVLLRFFEGRTFGEVGEKLQLTENAARMRVERALERLQVQLVQRGIKSTGLALAVAIGEQGVGAAPAGMAVSVASTTLTGIGSATAAGLGLGILQFMSINKIIVGALVLITTVSVGTAVHEFRSAADARSELLALQIDHRTTLEGAGKLKTQLQAAEQASSQGAVRVAALETELKIAKARAPTTPVTASDLFTNPEYARAYVEKFHAGVQVKYRALYRALRLTPDQIAKFESILVEGQQGVVDIWSEARKHGIPSGDDSSSATAVARLTSIPFEERDKALKDLLGEEGFSNFQTFDKNSATNDIVTSVAGSLYATENPLTPAQGEALASLITANTQRTKIPMASDGGTHPLYRLSDSTDWTAVEAQARSLLAPEQLVILHAYSEQQRLQVQMTEQQRLQAQRISRQQ